MPPKTSTYQDKLRTTVGQTVRELREEQRVSQAAFAKDLGFSQARLSQIERGVVSLTAEQLIILLERYNVPIDRFGAKAVADPDGQLQNALAREGAKHLHERADLPVNDRLRNLNAVVRDALASRVPRLLAALAPVIVQHIDRLNLERLHGELQEDGAAFLARRLLWTLENVREALREEQVAHLPRTWAQRYARAALILEAFLEKTGGPPQGKAWPTDVLDAQIRSPRTLAAVEASSTPMSKRWGIVTDLRPTDFAQALRASRALA